MRSQNSPEVSFDNSRKSLFKNLSANRSCKLGPFQRPFPALGRRVVCSTNFRRVIVDVIETVFHRVVELMFCYTVVTFTQKPSHFNGLFAPNVIYTLDFALLGHISALTRRDDSIKILLVSYLGGLFVDDFII